MILRSKVAWINDSEVLLTLEHYSETDSRTVFMKYAESDTAVPVLHFTATCKVYATSDPKVLFGTMQLYKGEWFFNDGKEDHRFPNIKEKVDFLQLELAELETAMLYIQQNPNLF